MKNLKKNDIGYNAIFLDKNLNTDIIYKNDCIG